MEIYLNYRGFCSTYQRRISLNFPHGLKVLFQDRRILFNGVKQQCLSMVMKPFIDKQSTISHKLDSLNPYELDSRRVLAEELNLSELEVRRLKENPPKDEELFGSRKRCDIDWVYISLHLFNNQRDPDDCKLQWQNFLHPGVNKEHWSPDESRKMLQTVAKHQVFPLLEGYVK